MGLVKAAIGAVGGVLADQWKDYYYCDAMDADVLVVKGQKRDSGRSSNRHGESDIISDGSGIAVADGQCMMIVEQGKVIELCAEPGVYTYDSKMTPSIFEGDLKSGLKGAALDAWERFQFGGGVGRDQRIYYFNTKEIIGNKYGTVTPIPFKVMIDKVQNISLPVDIRCNGEYSYKIVNPMLFYTTVCANITESYERESLDSQLKAELMKKLQAAFAKVAALGVDYSEIPLHADTIADELNEVLTPQWSAGRGIAIVSFGVNSVSVSEEDKVKIQNLQHAVLMSDVRIPVKTV
jgi:membrane protease subunit (stomatin/prohibitin family)